MNQNNEEISNAKVSKSNKDLVIPHGLYYFSQDGCSACYPKELVENSIQKYRDDSGVHIPEIQYVNLSSEENPTPLAITVVPTLFECNDKGIFVSTGSNAFSSWKQWRFDKETRNRMDEITEQKWQMKKQTEEYKITQELNKYGYRKVYKEHPNKELVKKCWQEVKEGREFLKRGY